VKVQALLATLSCLLGASNGPAFTYPDFSSTSGLNLTGDAAQVGTVLRLTTPAQNLKGAAWYTQKQPVAGGFTTSFRFRITDLGSSGGIEAGGDGISFAIQDSGISALATEYGAETNSISTGLGVSLNTFFNAGLEPSGNFIGITSNGSHWLIQRDLNGSSIDLSDGNEHLVQITCNGNSMSVGVDGTTFISNFPVSLGFAADGGGNSWVGFGARTGGAFENHDILNWSFSSGAPPPTNCVAAPSGLVSWWRGEGSTADAADANNGTVAGFGTFGYGPGVVGQAFVFDGIHRDRVDVGNPINLQLQDFTIEAWIKRSSATDISLDDNNQDGAVAGEGGLVFSYGRGGYGLGLLNDGHLLLSKIDVDGVFSTGVVSDTNWHHVAVAKSGSTTVFYVDGASASAGLPYTTSYTFDTSASIGSRGDARGGTFYGSIDEPSVYNRALSAAEVQAIYLASSTGKCRTPAPPSIVTQPMGQTAFVGDTVRFTVEATGDAPLNYQWRFNGLPLSGQAAPFLTVTNVQFGNAGNYSVLVTNVAGEVASSNALLTVNARPECAAAPAGLVSWWPGEDSTADAADGNYGTVAGYGSFDYGPGMVGRAFVFDGLHRDRVDVGNPTNLQLQDFTIEAWIKRASAADISLDDENQDGAVAGQGGLVFSYGRGGYGLGLLNDGRLLLSRIDVDGVFSTGVVADTNWHHVAVAKSGSTTVFYIDGASASAGLPYATSYTFDTPASIGSRGDARGGTFYGSIDEASVYNRALPAAEIQAIYRASVAGKCPIPSCAEVGPLMALVDGSNLARASQQALRASLDAACASLDRGALAAALNQLAAFQNKVNALVAPFDSALAATLTQAAQQVIDALGQRRPGGHVGVKFQSVIRRADGRARLSFVGAAGQAYMVEASTNLTDWEVIGVAGDRGDGSFDFEDTDAWRFSCRFYRIVSP
jgi:hypothetical protein